MYADFFGFTEKPFKLVPDPAYLYLSQSHEEALAHLVFSLSQGDGFVIITGEVGTGKTTLCRVFLDRLDINTEAAYIFNPKLDAVRLLSTINAEFRLPSRSRDTRELVDALNTYLLEQKSAGKTVVLVIDEAQNLSHEVLEQLRLLSNLETTRDKLLQIILVGQPELGHILASHELRQLRQRITLNCQLMPLTYPETEAYIHHRLDIAGQPGHVRFDRAVLKTVYKYSGGIPRLINIACDRALLSAFTQNRPRVTRRIARNAIRELTGSGAFSRSRVKRRFRVVPVTLTAVVILLVLTLWHPTLRNHATSLLSFKNRPSNAITTVPSATPPSSTRAAETVPPAAKPNPVPDARKTEVPAPPATPKRAATEPVARVVETAPEPRRIYDPAHLFLGLDSRISRSQALETTLDLWHPGAVIEPVLNNLTDDRTFFRLAAAQNGLIGHPIACDIELIKTLNLPAILVLQAPVGPALGYLTIVSIDGQQITVQQDNTRFVTDATALTPYCTETVFVIWKNFTNINGTIPYKAPPDALVNLKLLLRAIGFKALDIEPVYDAATQNAVKTIQSRHGLAVDGVVGSLTKIVLYNEKEGLPIPHIVAKK